MPAVDMDTDFSDAALESPTLLLTPTGSTSTSPAFTALHPVDVAAPAAPNGRPCRSQAWLHFQKTRDYRTSHKAACMHCSTVLVASHGSTTTMLLHLQRKHPDHLAARAPGR
jgi:BED zinc finger